MRKINETAKVLNSLYTVLEINTDPICISRGETTEAMMDYLRVYCPGQINKNIVLTGKVLLAMSRVGKEGYIGK